MEIWITVSSHGSCTIYNETNLFDVKTERYWNICLVASKFRLNPNKIVSFFVGRERGQGKEDTRSYINIL
jgi:hypothetical protein